MASHSIIDIATDPAKFRRHKRRRLFAQTLPIMVVILIFSGMFVVTFLNYQSNKKDVLVLAENFLGVLENRIRAQTDGALSQAKRVVEFGAEIVSNNPGNIGFEGLALSALRKLGLISAVYVARSNGDFLMIRKNDEGGFDTKRIVFAAGGRHVTLTKRSLDGTLIERLDLPDDTFDPRSRPWYKLAERGGDKVSWTDVYQFFTSGAPGATVSLAVRSPDGRVEAVVGADVRVDTLSRYLMDLDVVENGHAVLLAGNGDVVAAPSLLDSSAPLLRAERLPTVEDLGDPALVRAYDIIRVHGDRMEFTQVDGKKVFILVSSLQETTEANLWMVLIAPESDFTYFLVRNSLIGMIISGVLIFCALCLAVWLFLQNRRIDRRARVIQEQRRWLAGLEGIFEGIRGTVREAQGDPGHALAQLVGSLARNTDARSASIWRRYGDELRCLACYDAENRGQTLLMPVERWQAPEVFDAMSRDEDVTLRGAEAERPFVASPRSREETSPDIPVFVAPILARGKGFGLVVLETPDLMRRSEVGARLAAHYAAAVALLALEVEEFDSDLRAARPGTGRKETAPAAALLVGDPSVVSLREPARTGWFAGRERAGPPTAVPGLSVLELTCRDDHGLGQAVDGDRPLFDRIVEIVREVAERHDIPYVKLLGSRFQLASGLAESERDGADRLLDAGLEIQYDLRALFRSHAMEPAFAIGIDTGTALGWSLSEPEMINLWGGPARLAERLAASAPGGAIQVGGRTVELLSDHFVFRRRGRYHLEAGECIDVSLVVGRAA